MKIAIIGATGRVGTRLIDEALSRGHTVTAIARQADKLAARPGLATVNADADDPKPLAAALAGHEVAISTVRFLQTSAAQIVGAVKANDLRGTGLQEANGADGDLMAGEGGCQGLGVCCVRVDRWRGQGRCRA